MVMIKTIMKSKVMMRMRKVRVILMIEFLPRRGPILRSGIIIVIIAIIITIIIIIVIITFQEEVRRCQ